ncbi:MAG TPA: hypothetical protein VN132_10380 [Bdellovibrio sp.]|nr:hypothetical protein [Bdellovibrio sp.]
MFNTFFYLPKNLMRFCNLAVDLGFVSVFVFICLLLLGFNFKNNRFVIELTAGIAAFAFGTYFSVVSAALFYENRCRYRDSKPPYFAINRMSSWQHSSFLAAQLMDVGYFLFGILVLKFGVDTLISL